jgi:hypothetical protein
MIRAGRAEAPAVGMFEVELHRKVMGDLMLAHVQDLVPIGQRPIELRVGKLLLVPELGAVDLLVHSAELLLVILASTAPSIVVLPRGTLHLYKSSNDYLE